MKNQQPHADACAGTLIIRDGVVVYASEGAAALAGRRVDEALGRPYTDFVVEEQRSILLDRHARRMRGEVVPQRYEVSLLLPDGRLRAVEIHVEEDGGESLVHMRDVSGQRVRRLRLDSVATLGAAIQRERTEDGIHARVREELSKLGLSSGILAHDAQGVRMVWGSFPSGLRPGLLAASETAFDGGTARCSEFFGRLSAEGAAFAEDFALEVSCSMPEDLAKEVRRLVSAEGMGRAAAARVEQRDDAQSYLFVAGDWLRPDDLPTVRLFGAQLGAALDAARTISDLSHRNADLAVLNRIAELAGEATDLATLFEPARDVLNDAVGCRGLSAYVLDEPAGELVCVFQQGAPLEVLPRWRRRPLEGLAAEAILRRAPQTLEVPGKGPGSQFAELGFRTLAWIPLVVRSKIIGLLGGGFADPEGRVRERLELLTAAAAHFASAIESQTLLGRLRRRLSDLEAVHALGERVFENAPGDMPALLRDACREAAKALSCRNAILYLAEEDGGTVRSAAAWGTELDGNARELRAGDDGLACEAMRRRAPAWSDDVKRDPRGEERGRDVREAALAVPVTSRDATRGVLYLSDRAGRAFADAEVALANALAGELAVGLENAELYADLRRRIEQLSLLHEVGRSLVTTLDIGHVLDRGVQNLARIVDAPSASLSLASADGVHLEICAVAGAHVSHVGKLLPIDPPEDSLAALVFRRREPILVEDALSDARVNAGLRAATGARACLGIPLLVRDRTIGCVVIMDTRGPRRFTPAEVERAAAIANQLAVAVENARLYEDLRKSYADLERAQQQIIQGERLAALGELSAVVAHEVRNPLGVIFNSLGTLRRLLRPEGDAKMLLDIVGEEADRLNRIVGDLLDFARPSTPQLRPEPFDRVVDEAIGAALAQNPSAIEFTREIDRSVPPVPMDARLVRQAVLNVVVNAVQAMPRGGRISVRTRREGDAAVLEIADTGPGISEELKERIFEPFFTTKASGTGLGLAVVKRIVDGHGGSVAVRGEPGSGTVFALRFPLAANRAVENAAVMG